MLNKLRILILLAITIIGSSTHSADIVALKNLYTDNFNNYYQPRFCGKNIRRFLEEASRRNIDLSNSYVLKVVGGGFLETSGFYTRGNINEREMLGYFHMILIADDQVFDFDLNEPLVLEKESYVRLQFTPPHEPYFIFGIDYSAKGSPGDWNLTAFDRKDYTKGDETTLWKMKMKKYINIKKMLNIERVR
jgi:hypothetical protein